MTIFSASWEDPDIKFSNGVAACIASDGTPVGVMDGLTPTGAWSASRKLFTAYAGSNYSSAPLFTFFDQSGNARDFTTGSTATNPTVPCTARVAGVLFDSDQDWLDTAAPITDFIAAANGYMIVTIRPTSFATNGTPGYNNSSVLFASSQNAGITTSNNGGSPIAWITNWDGSADQVSVSIAANTTYVLEWRHEGGVLYQRKNGTGETSTASGNTDLSVATLNMGGRNLAPSSFMGQIFEAAVFSTVPNLATRDALVQSFGLYAGAAV